MAFSLSRIWCLLFVYIGHLNHPYLESSPDLWPGVSHWWLNPLTAFDSLHYLTIAAEGYNAKIAAFFPLYPLCLKLAGPSQISMAAWGVAISNACFLAALLVFARLTERDYTPRLAHIAVWLLAFCPTTIYFSAVYTESLFLLLFVLAFWNLRNGRWLLAAGWVFLAALTRNAAPLLFLGVLLEFFAARKRGVKFSVPIALAIIAPLAAMVLAQCIISLQIGGFGQSLSSQSEYYRALMLPFVPILYDLRDVFSATPNGITVLQLGATLAAFVLVARAWKKQALSYSVMILGLMLMNLTLARTIYPYTGSAARYTSTMFPFTQRVAVEVEVLFSSRFRRVITATMLLIACAVVSYAFGIKSFVG